MDIQLRICNSKDSLLNASQTLAHLLRMIYKENVQLQRFYLILKGMAQHLLQPSIEKWNNIGGVTLLNPVRKYFGSNCTLCS